MYSDRAEPFVSPKPSALLVPSGASVHHAALRGDAGPAGAWLDVLASLPHAPVLLANARAQLAGANAMKVTRLQA